MRRRRLSVRSSAQRLAAACPKCGNGADLIGKYGIYIIVKLTKTQNQKSEYKFTQNGLKRLHKGENVKKVHSKLTICTNNP